MDVKITFIRTNFLSQRRLLFAFLFFAIAFSVQAQFVHPGLTNKLSDLDRVKYMVEAQVDPWYTSYQEMISDSKASYNYTVRGDQSFTELGRDNGVNYNAWNDDIRAAYYNAIQWYLTGDTRHAEKSVEIFNAWNNLQDVTSGGTQALSGGIAYIMIEAAEIIKSTYTGWSESDIQDFKDMLVYPGYSTTAEPSGISRVSGSFYWQAYQGDPVRHGNQGLAGFRAVMAMGIFMDNEIMYERALRYIQGLPHRPDDLPYPAGPPQATTISNEGDYEDTYNYTVGNSIEDFGYNEVMTNYIYDNGQCQESSRDQQHTFFGIGNLCAMAEMAWNQGDDLYSHVNDRLLLGLEYSSKYNVSYLQSYPDQTTHWIPTVESGEFMQRFNASQRVYSKLISPTHVGGYIGERPVLEMPLAHYYGRGFKTIDEVKWTARARDVAIDQTGYEAAGHQNGAIGWGALTSRRPEGCYGEPISGFDLNGLPEYAMNVLPATLEAENFDYSPVSGEGRTYHETTVSNNGGQYRVNEAIDIEECDEGGYNVNAIADGEWLTFTVYIPETKNYGISMRYASDNASGTVQLLFGGNDKTGFVSMPSTGGVQVWQDLTLIEEVELTKGVQSMKVLVGTGGFNINNITVSLPKAETVGDVFILDDIEYTITNLEPNQVEVSGSTLTELSIPSIALDPLTAKSYTVTAIGSEAFIDNTILTSVILPDTVVSLGSKAFSGASSLASINLENVVTFAGSEFGNTALTSVDLSNAINIGGYSFYSISTLTSVTMPVVEIMGNGVFRNSGITSLNLPSSLTSIGNQLFRQCDDVRKIQVNWTDPVKDVAIVVANAFGNIDPSLITLYVPVGTKDIYQVTEPWSQIPVANIIEGVLSINDLEQELGFTIYPNPTKDMLSIKSKQLESAEVIVYDLNGRVLLSNDISGASHEINISSFSSGVYLLKIKVENSEFVKRIIKK
ncbi:leucine-rich repeat protein [Algibacter sp. L4_22]|uniref:leucine-rich repeat protein n=1 Tax=Algibacter sp. L4_22 TaxID=2942477 RepID=UPI00201B771E|nr:leucine-rich repeat protein [Algibacter sp. L4_22]MCL5129610.1 leucine-rich repeat protein [Algibacter sp. L4_22]